jgi:RNA polymerase sigma-70 factor (ECF subfamily)
MDPLPRTPATAAAEAEAEAALVSRAREGDGDAFRALVDAYKHRVFGLALRIVRSREEAEEVAQDAFLRAWRALPAFRGDARFSTWLYRIVMRRAMDSAAAIRRRRAREIEIDGVDAGDMEDTGNTGGPLVEDARARRLEALIARLPEGQRTVVTLYYYQDRSIEEVARALSIPDGTVKTHLHRARAALRAALLRAASREETR